MPGAQSVQEEERMGWLLLREPLRTCNVCAFSGVSQEIGVGAWDVSGGVANARKSVLVPGEMEMETETEEGSSMEPKGPPAEAMQVVMQRDY
jgi:hypothetical protein